MRYLQKIIYNKDSLTAGEKKIADYVLKHPEKLKQLSSQNLATILGISQSSIIKFAQKMGLKGFTNLKMALIEEWSQRSFEDKRLGFHLHNDIDSHDSLQNIAEKLLLEKQNALRNSTDSLDFDQLEQIIEKIRNAKKVQIVGIGGSALVAKDLAYKMMKIGYSAMNELDSHVQITIAQSLDKEDVQIVLSFSGKLKEVLIAAEAAKKKGACIIAITSLQHNPLRELADYTLDTLANETQLRSSSISARTAQHTITDLLFVCLLQREGERNINYIQQSQQLIEKLNK